LIFKQWREILAQQKTQTRRIADRYKVGSVQSVTPKMYKHAIWWKEGVEPIPEPTTSITNVDGTKAVWDHRPALASQGYQPLKVCITAKRREPLQAITEADARAEGVASVAEYAALWDSINKKKGTRFADNPMVTVYTFELVNREAA
jgi:hypothetical protein